ncbi:MAG: TonB-dependent receptor [Wenzhouxiangellaceae bacterium]|nr:TonB-dependent receptor [Wenzhouxiangellaceae bacterium]
MAAALGSMVGGVVWAQDVDEEEEESVVQEADAAEEEDGTSDRVVVTGSRVARNEYTSISPVQVIDSEVARDLGLVDAADLLRQTTVVQGQQITTGVSTSAGLLTASGPGSASASLRGLDAGRTLVLVNGRRLAPAGVRGAPSAPDLNLIPGTLIQRTEVLLDGASSIYGSDAVAGVVNFILRTDFDGLQLDAFYTDPQMSNDAGKQQVYSATWGVNNDKGFMGFAAEYSKTDSTTAREFGDFYRPYAGDCISSIQQGASGTLYEQCTGAFGAGSASTSAFGFLGFDPDVDLGVPGLPQGFFPIPVTADLLTPGSENGANLLLFPEELDAIFQPDFDRTTIYSVGEYSPGWYGDMTTYFEASWSSRQTSTNTSGQGAIDIPGTYPVGNFGGLQGTLFYSSRFLNKTDVSQTRIVGGVKGDLPFMDIGTLKNWYYDGYVSYSRSTGNDSVSGIPFFPRLEQTLNNTRFDEATGQFVCDPRGIPGEGQQVTCRPLNFFDPTFIFTGRFPDAEDNEFLFPNRITDTTVVQKVYSGFIAGELFDIPWGGPLSLVLGGEFREDSIGTDTDAGASRGDFLGFFGDPGSNGERWLKEGFIEIDMPLVLDKPLVHELSVNFAGRLTEEQFFGSEPTYRIQGQYAPVDWFRARATFGTSFRAPNLGEQFGGRVTGFANPADPCRTPGVAVPFVDDDGDPSTPEVRLYNPDLDPRDPEVIQNCINGGGPFNIPGTDPFSLGIVGLGTQNPVFLGAPTQVASGSNPNLDAETSEALSAGIVFEQPWTDRFDLRVSATYFNIEVDDEVDQLTAGVIVNRCYNSPGLTDRTCEFVTRDPRVSGDVTSGEISFVEALNQNLGTQEVEGIDYNAEFRTDFPLAGLEQRVNFNFVLRATRMLTQTEEEFQVEEVFIDDDLREFGNPKWRVNLTGGLGYGDWSFLWQSRYISSMIEDNDDPEDEITTFFSPCIQAGDTPCLSFDNLSDYWVHDASLAWRGETTIVRAGVSNVFDNAPPLTNNNGLGSIGGIGYDLRGRTLFANITWGF